MLVITQENLIFQATVSYGSQNVSLKTVKMSKLTSLNND